MLSYVNMKKKFEDDPDWYHNFHNPDYDNSGQSGYPHQFHTKPIEPMVEDYILNKNTSILYLSLAYHKLYPLYIKGRM